MHALMNPRVEYVDNHDGRQSEMASYPEEEEEEGKDDRTKAKK